MNADTIHLPEPAATHLREFAESVGREPGEILAALARETFDRAVPAYPCSRRSTMLRRCGLDD